MSTIQAGLHVRRKRKHKPRVNRDDASTSARSFFLCLCLRRPGSYVHGLCMRLRRTCKPASNDRPTTNRQPTKNERVDEKSISGQSRTTTNRPTTDWPATEWRSPTKDRSRSDQGPNRLWVSLIFFPNRARPKAPRGVWPEWRRSEIEHRAESRQLTGQLLNDDQETENRCKATRDGPPIERQSNKTQRLDRMSIDKRPKADEKSIGVRSGTGHLSIDRRIRGSGSIEYRSINDRKPMISRSEWDQGRTT